VWKECFFVLNNGGYYGRTQKKTFAKILEGTSLGKVAVSDYRLGGAYLVSDSGYPEAQPGYVSVSEACFSAGLGLCCLADRGVRLNCSVPPGETGLSAVALGCWSVVHRC
jgi:hypothetical protein